MIGPDQFRLEIRSDPAELSRVTALLDDLRTHTFPLSDVERAILSRHNMILLGLRGQAKTRLARQMISLLDEWIPIVYGSELQDDPFAPLSRGAVELLAQHGDETRIGWLHRSDR